MSTPIKKKTAKEIFNLAVEYYEPHQWEGYLVDACGDDETLRQRVRELLDAHRQSDSFLDGKAEGTEDLVISERPGSTIGPYKLLQQIGEGGFGVVYMAEQLEPVSRKVALKIIKPGMDTKQVIARFEAERQALAMMDHPNIAKVLDAGATESGRPYFVMELVKGVPVTEFCDTNKLSTRDRLELFVTVCRAVQHAHQKGVIHRDLKPTNVMVTLHDNKPMPVIIDFGVSKAISHQLTEKTLFTAYGQMVGTPAYMSPEQAQMSRMDIDTRSDIYSLGVLLYELLTGSTPLDAEQLRGTAYAEMQRLIQEEEAPKPSTRLSTLGNALAKIAQARSTDPRRLGQFLRGDLDWIALKALEKERNRRYETANGLANDVERFLNDDTIEARPPSVSYQLARLIRRHKGAATAAAAVLVILLLGIAGTTTGLFAATAAKEQAIIQAQEADEAKRVAVGLRQEAQANLTKSESLAKELSVSLTRLSEGAARLAVHRAHTLIGQDRPQDGLLWLDRALGLAPGEGTPLEREIRTAMSVVSDDLPRPLFILSPDDGQVFSQTKVSRDGGRILLLVATDPPADPKSIEARVIDSRNGVELSRFDVSEGTYWVGFSGDRKTVWTADTAELRRYSSESGASIGSAYDLAGALEEYSQLRSRLQGRLTQLRGNSPTDQSVSSTVPQNARYGTVFLPRVVAVDPLGKTLAFSVPEAAVSDDEQPVQGGRDRFAGRGGPINSQRVFGLLDLESGRTRLLPKVTTEVRSDPSLQFAADGRRVFLSAREPQSGGTAIREVDIAADQFEEGWQQELLSLAWQWSMSAARDRALVVAGRTVHGEKTFGVLDTQSGELTSAGLDVSEAVIDSAMSPSGRRAVVLTSTDPQSTRLIVWDIEQNRSRSISLRLPSSNTSADPLAASDLVGLRFSSRLTPPRGNVAIGASEETVFTWDHDMLIGWQLAGRPTKRPDIATATTVQSLAYAGDGSELTAITYGTTISGRRQSSSLRAIRMPLEIQRFDTRQRRPIGLAVPILANLAAVSPNGKVLVTARGNEIQRWDLATMSKIGKPILASSSGTNGRTRAALSHLEFVDGGRILVSHRSIALSPFVRNMGGPRVTYYKIGVYMDDGVDEGVRVRAVEPNSPAESAGLVIDDVIQSIGGEQVKTDAEMRRCVDREGGDGLEVTLLRGGAERTIRLHPKPRKDEDIVQQTASARGEVRLWDMESGRELGPLPIPLEGRATSSLRFSAAVSPDGRSVVTLSRFGPRTELRQFDATSGRPVAPSVEYPRLIREIQYGPRGQVLATIDLSSEVQLWNANDLTRIGARLRPEGSVAAMAFDCKGDALLLTAETGTGPRLTLWDTGTGHRLSPQIELPAAADRLACNPDGKSLAMAGVEGHVWEVPLPAVWDTEMAESTAGVEALAGCRLSEHGDVEPLEADRWRLQLAQLDPMPRAERPRPSADSQIAWNNSDPLLELPSGPGTLEQRQATLDAMIAERPGDWAARLERAAMLLAQERLDAADADFEAAAADGDREWIIAWLKRHAVRITRSAVAPGIGPRDEGWFDIMLGRYLWYCERLVELEPNEPTGLLLQVSGLSRAGRFDEAEAVLQAAWDVGAEDLVSENLRAIATTRVIAPYPTMPTNSLFAALYADATARAVWAHDQLVELRPDDRQPLIDRAAFDARRGRIDAALADIDRAAALGPVTEIAEPLKAAGVAVYQGSLRRRPADEAGPQMAHLHDPIRFCERVIAMAPDDVATGKALADLYGRSGDWEKAADRLARLAELDADDYSSRSKLASVLLKLGRSERYVELCQEMQEKFGDSITAPLWQAGTMEDYGPIIEYQEARLANPDLETSVRHYAQWYLGCAYFRSGANSEAIEWMAKCLESTAVRAHLEVRSRSVMAMAYYESDEQTKAREMLDRAVEVFAEEAPQSGVDDPSSGWQSWLVCELLLDEARSRIGGDKEPGDIAPTQEDSASKP